MRNKAAASGADLLLSIKQRKERQLDIDAEHRNGEEEIDEIQVFFELFKLLFLIFFRIIHHFRPKFVRVFPHLMIDTREWPRIFAAFWPSTMVKRVQIQFWNISK